MNDLTSKYVGVDSKFNPNLRFLENEIRNYRILCLPGGTRSGKTYSTVQWIWRQMEKYSGVEYSIVRATSNALSSTVLKDFVEIGEDAGIYSLSNHHLTKNIYRHNGNIVDFFASDDDNKSRGRKRDVLYLNEGPEIDWKIVKQYLFRTNAKIIIDYNPSYPESWVYDNILTRSNCAFITTTYKDNPHISEGSLAEIEWMRENDPDSYLIYGLGQRGQLRGQIYKNWNKVKEMPADIASVFVIDFGYANSHCCIAEFKNKDRAVYGRERLYKLNVLNHEIAIHLFFMGADDSTPIIADSAEPKSIAELMNGYFFDKDYLKGLVQQLGYPADDETLAKLDKWLRAGLTILGAIKGNDSVNSGIQKVKQFEIFITEDSPNAAIENKMYRWGEDPKTGNLLNVPIKKHDHFCDCLRYYTLMLGVYV